MSVFINKTETISSMIPVYKETLSNFFNIAKIKRVEVTYSGCGDSGSIECIIIYSKNGNTVYYYQPHDKPNPKKEFDRLILLFPMNIPLFDNKYDNFFDFISILSEVFLEVYHPGWELDDGSKGTIIYEKSKKAHEFFISIEHIEFYTTSSEISSQL